MTSQEKEAKVKEIEAAYFTGRYPEETYLLMLGALEYGGLLEDFRFLLELNKERKESNG